jgi:actin-like ATPase involved in cell morphogenesis
METPKFITLQTDQLDNIIINAINKVYGSHIGYITTALREALIENAIVVKTMYSVVRDNEERKESKEITWDEAVEQYRKYGQLVKKLNPRKA